MAAQLQSYVANKTQFAAFFCRFLFALRTDDRKDRDTETENEI